MDGGVDACHLAVELEIGVANIATGLCPSNSVLLYCRHYNFTEMAAEELRRAMDDLGKHIFLLGILGHGYQY